MALLNFGTNPQAPDYQQAVEDNVQRYEDEISNAMNFMIRLMPRVAIAARGFMQSLSEAERNQPTRQQGVKNIRDGYMQTVSGATSFVAGGPKVPNARLVARALRDTVDEWRALASADERTQLVDVINQARQGCERPGSRRKPGRHRVGFGGYQITRNHHCAVQPPSTASAWPRS